MLDIIFISYDEPNADINWRRLKDRFPHSKRVHGVKGIANAHIEAANRSHTRFFYVVDGDAEIDDSFDFSYKPQSYDEEYVHIWYAENPAIGASYGYGGVKLFNKRFFKNVTSQLDFSTTLTANVKILPELSCVTRFNSDPFRSYRGAYREAVKLYTTANSGEGFIQAEARERLERWLNPNDCEFREYIVAGATDGVEEAKRKNDLMFINDHDLMNHSFKVRHPQLDEDTSPLPKENHPMRHELFFTTRIASALYDPYVAQKLPLMELRDALSDGQLLSKVWLIEELDKLMKLGYIHVESKEQPLRVAILGGWIGTLALMMNTWELPLHVTSVDLDARSNRIAEKLNYDYAFTTMTMDMYDVDYTKFDVIINTSSEHIPDIARWREGIPAGKIVIVQNNNFADGEGHVSCVTSVHQLKHLLKLSESLYEGTRQFPQYNRFMLIGRT